ncbi:MAG TPA: PilZ domain-containing protein [Candidatus Acidoferrales bacterium]|nr:PilZ domain-containing protein [Candidatus Acidoferrales bacterium]
MRPLYRVTNLPARTCGEFSFSLSFFQLTLAFRVHSIELSARVSAGLPHLGRRMEASERRKNPRYRCSAPVRISWGEVTLEATLHDISATGMYLETAEPLWLRAEFSASVLLPERLSVRCVVRRVDDGKGMVVEFTELSSIARMNLNHLLWKLAHP